MIPANKQQNNARRRSGLVLALVGLLSVTGLVKGPTTPASAQAEARSWSYTGSLNVARNDHTATRLPDGKVLVVGGCCSPYAAGSAELYDPITGLWSVTGNLNAVHSFFTATHTATLLEDGKVLVAGGNTAEVYDPVTGLWSLTGNLNVGHYSHTATLLRDGKVLIAGGGDSLNLFATNAAEVYDPATGRWSLVGHLSEGRLAHTATLLANGEVLVAGGAGDVEGFGILNSAELYDPATKTWRYTGSLNTLRADYAAVLLPNGDVLVAGGDWVLPSDESEIYHVAEGTWSNNAGFSGRFYPTLTLLQNGKALTTGGAIFGRYGGFDPGSTFSDAHLYNPATGSWKQTAKLNEPRATHTATLLSDGKVLVVGGQSAELYDPEILDPAPKIISASVSGIKLFITGENFDDGAVILLNGEEKKTKQPAANPQTSLIGKKAGKKIKAGDLIQVRNPDGTLSAEFIFTGS